MRLPRTIIVFWNSPLECECGVQPRRGVRVAEGARLESVFGGNPNVGSNPTLSAIPIKLKKKDLTIDVLKLC